ncbi:HAD family hydrolase [Actinocatenispora rupis]|uniref:Haloacid dehalogenase n=1 Tax=Actinocatenispora rupis TaxID=519421 RepID=A0A8J3J2Q4_9ACTN|nr:HAD family hydrolase [Actinocatenispora rupis]GID13103.1 haloacid dehalogenase [Actinocatenispora rupis]
MSAGLPGLVVLDLDGTVTPYSNSTDQPSERVRRAIAGVRAAGVPVTVATGRAVWGALRGVHALGLADGAPLDIVCSNGSVVYDVERAETTHRVLIDPGPAIRAVLAVNPAAGLAVEDGTDGYLYNGAFELNFESSFVGPADVPTLMSTPTPRLVCRIPGDEGYVSWHDGRRVEAAALAESAGLAGLGYSVEIGFSGWIDVAAGGVSKATGAAMVAADLGVDPADVVAVGDGNNDLPLFAWAGRAVAMGQAADRIRAAADEVTGTVEEDGVAQLLERWL